LDTRLGKSIVISIILEDITSLVLLSLLLQTSNQITVLPLPLYYIFLLSALVGIRIALPKLKNLFISRWTNLFKKKKEDLFQQELRLTFAILIGIVVIFELLGLHAIIGGFFAGLLLSEILQSEILKAKFKTLSYGIFIPIFFIMVGAQTNFAVLFETKNILLFTFVLITASIGSKFLSGWIGGLLSGFNARQSMLIGAATTPQLSTTLAVVFTAFDQGYFEESVLAAMILLSGITTLVGPLVISTLGRKLVEEKDVK